ncbi:hypothetical protein PoB_002262800 [Plakobranchus ocellatus]|uniref:Uncharacterized protein n=1 Tax=Plakobranchus ocellatus TaxID=259542 RepID=A0AAV3ZMR7_9GAST|nr:hypothetical protein PoB_002262800 [Plakobranchus ocellatus]
MKEKYHWLSKTFGSHQVSFAPSSLQILFLPPSNQAVAGMTWRQEAPPDFRETLTLMPPAEYKIHSKEIDACIKMLSWILYMEAFTAEISRKAVQISLKICYSRDENKILIIQSYNTVSMMNGEQVDDEDIA